MSGQLEWPVLARLFDGEPYRGSARAALTLAKAQEPSGMITRTRFGGPPSQVGLSSALPSPIATVTAAAADAAAAAAAAVLVKPRPASLKLGRPALINKLTFHCNSLVVQL